MIFIEKTEGLVLHERMYKGEKDGFAATLYLFHNKETGVECWWFYLSKGNFRFNSLWINDAYDSRKQCENACEEMIDVAAKQDLEKSTFNGPSGHIIFRDECDPFYGKLQGTIPNKEEQK